MDRLQTRYVGLVEGKKVIWWMKKKHLYNNGLNCLTWWNLEESLESSSTAPVSSSNLHAGKWSQRVYIDPVTDRCNAPRLFLVLLCSDWDG